MKQIKNSGQSLIEVAIALGVTAVVIAAIVSTVVSSLASAQFNRDFNLATSYSQEGIEIARSLQDSSYKDHSYCLAGGVSTPTVCPSPMQPNITSGTSHFLRTISFSGSTSCGTYTQVVVKTAWTDGKCSPSSPFCHSSILKTCTTNF